MKARIPFPRTLSARIILGFAVVTITVGVISANTILKMDRLDHEIRVIRMAYLGLALKARDLAEKQHDLVNYLRSDLEGESTPARVRARLRRARADRERLLSEMQEILEDVDPPRNHIRILAKTRTALTDNIRLMVTNTEDDYFLLKRHPPLAREHSGAEEPEFEEAKEALTRLRRLETTINSQTQTLEVRHTRLVKMTAKNLETGSEVLRRLTIVFGACAVGVGVLVAVLVALSLRPLRRLPRAARRIAQGDYVNRIPERGPAEVYELARELNIMGTALDERERELVRSERLAAIGQMAASIAHEVRNPLSSIGLNAELLDEEFSRFPADETKEGRGLCQAITAEVDRLTELTETYLAFARLPKPKLAREQMNDLIASLTGFERENMASRNVEITLELEEELPLVAADETQIRQALRNLLRNAVDAMSDVGGGSIVLRTRTQPDGVRIEVEDDGPGIARELQPRLFDPFFSTKERGTGLGLALTQQIVREHRGSLRVDSAPGHGAKFVICLPFAEPEPAGEWTKHM